MDNSGFLKDPQDQIEKCSYGYSTEKSEKGVKLERDQEKVYSFEEAAVLTGTGKFHYFLFMVCGFCFLSVMVEVMGTSVILPFMKCDLSSTITEQGLLASSGFFGVVLSSYFMGFLADTWGRVRTLRLALVGSFVMAVISAFSVNIWMLIMFRFANGLFICACQSCVFSYLGEFHGRQTRVRYVTLLSVFMPLGLILFPGMSVAILPIQIEATVLGLKLKSWRLFLLANSIISLLALCGLYLTPESPKYLLIQGKQEEALRVFRKVFRLNTGKPESEYAVKRMDIEISGASLSDVHGMSDIFKLIWSQTVPLFYKDQVLHTLNLCCHMFIIYGVAQGTYMWFPTMLKQLDATSDQGYLFCEAMYMLGNSSTNATTDADSCGAPVNTEISEILSLSGLVFFITYMMISVSITVVGKKNLLRAVSCITLASCLMIHWVSSFVWSAVLMTLVINVGTCGGVVATIAIEHFPTNTSAMAMCLIMMFSRLGSVAFSNLVGAMLFTNCNALFYVYVGAVALVLVCSIFLPHTGGRKK